MYRPDITLHALYIVLYKPTWHLKRWAMGQFWTWHYMKELKALSLTQSISKVVAHVN